MQKLIDLSEKQKTFRAVYRRLGLEISAERGLSKYWH